MAKKKDKNKDAVNDDDVKDALAPGMAGDNAEAPAEGDAPFAKSKRKMLFMGLFALLLLGGIGGGLYYVKFYDKKEEKTIIAIGPDGKPIEKPVYYTLPEFLINLNTSGRQTSFLKTTVILELVKQSDVPVVEANLPRLLDAINTYMRELRASDLSGSAGIQRLREELMLRTNKVLEPIKINDVLFKEIIVQ